MAGLRDGGADAGWRLDGQLWARRGPMSTRVCMGATKCRRPLLFLPSLLQHLGCFLDLAVEGNPTRVVNPVYLNEIVHRL